MRRMWEGAAVIALGFLLSHLAAVYDWRFGLACGVVTFVIGWGLVFTSGVAKQLWGWASEGIWRMFSVVVLTGVVTGVVAAGVAAAMIVHVKRVKAAAIQQQQATGSQPTPAAQSLSPASPQFREKVERITIMMGGLTAANPVEALDSGVMVPLVLYGTEPARVYREGGQTYVDAKIWGGPGKAPLEIHRNEFTLRTPEGWDRNFSDTAIEVVNPDLVPMFQLIYETPSRIRINGVFPSAGGVAFVVNDRLLLNPSTPVYPARIFKYPSWKYKGIYE